MTNTLKIAHRSLGARGGKHEEFYLLSCNCRNCGKNPCTSVSKTSNANEALSAVTQCTQTKAGTNSEPLLLLLLLLRERERERGKGGGREKESISSGHVAAPPSSPWVCWSRCDLWAVLERFAFQRRFAWQVMAPAALAGPLSLPAWSGTAAAPSTWRREPVTECRRCQPVSISF